MDFLANNKETIIAVMTPIVTAGIAAVITWVISSVLPPHKWAVAIIKAIMDAKVIPLSLRKTIIKYVGDIGEAVNVEADKAEGLIPDEKKTA